MYRGSSTMFKSIYQINLNFHFRTRNLESWKVNDGNASYDTSATTDNWFITDFHVVSIQTAHERCLSALKNINQELTH